MDSVQIEVFGGAEMAKNIASLDAKLAKKVVRGALRKGAKIALNRAKQLVPVRHGLLRDSLKIKVGKMKGGANASGANAVQHARVYLTIGKSEGRAVSRKERGTGEMHEVKIFPQMYAFQVEFGARGRKAHPFIRPAIEQTSAEFLKLTAEAIHAAWQKEVVEKGL